MGLNDIQLNSTLLTAFYADALVLTDDAPAGAAAIAPTPAHSNTATEEPVIPAAPATPARMPSATTGSYLGNNGKNISIIVQYPGIPHLPDSTLEFLTRMLQACKLGLGDVAIQNLGDQTSVVGNDITGELASKIVLLFGINPADFGLAINFPEFQVQPLAGITYLYAPPLEICQNDKLVKSKLWVCLQRIFGI